MGTKQQRKLGAVPPTHSCPLADQFEFVEQMRETIPILVGQIPVVRPADPFVAH